jgi:hypothetical protein
MDVQEAVALLRRFNAWRCGAAHVPDDAADAAPVPREVTKAIDTVCAALAKREAVPADVMAALDRMCEPLHDSILPTSSETAMADAHSMEVIRNYIMAKPTAADDEVTENLVALVGRLSYALRKANPANGLPAKAMSYLEGAGFKFHMARHDESAGAADAAEAAEAFASLFEETVRKVEITASGHAVGADKSGDRYQTGFASGFYGCWKIFAMLAASQQAKEAQA